MYVYLIMSPGLDVGSWFKFKLRRYHLTFRNGAEILGSLPAESLGSTASPSGESHAATAACVVAVHQILAVLKGNTGGFAASVLSL